MRAAFLITLLVILVAAWLFHGMMSTPGWIVSAAVFWGSVSNCVQNRLSKPSGHGKRLIVSIDLTHKGVTP